MHSFEQQNDTNLNPQKGTSEIIQEKVADNLLKVMNDNHDKLYHVTIFPGTGNNPHNKINEVLQQHGLRPLEIVLSCGFIYKAEIHLKAAEELAVLESVHSIHQDWSAQSFFE